MGDILTGDQNVDTAWIGGTPHERRYSMRIRPGTSDANTVMACAWGNDEYHLPTGLTGWALDIGAHIGACTIPLLLDNPDLRVIAVEALPENVLLLNENALRNGVADRLTIVHGAASDTHDEVLMRYGNDTTHEYIGGAVDKDGTPGDLRPAIRLKGITLGAMAALRPDPTEPFVWCKIDAEGAEYQTFRSSHLRLLEHIEGEVHFGWQRLVDLLDATHIVTGPGQDFGPFQAVLRS